MVRDEREELREGRSSFLVGTFTGAFTAYACSSKYARIYRLKSRSELAWSRRGLPLVASWGTSRVAPGDTKGQEPIGLPAAAPRPRLCGAQAVTHGSHGAVPGQGLAAS